MRRKAAFSSVATASVLILLTTVLGIFSTGLTVLANGSADAITAALDGKDPSIFSFTGTIIEIREYTGDATRHFIMVEDDKEAQINFVATADTYYPDGTMLSEGMTVTGYYDAYRPALLIYPPQPDAVAFVSADEPDFVKIERFDGELISYDGILKLNIGDDTEIITQNGDRLNLGSDESWTDILAGKVLVAFYGVTTRSIPAQTTPSKIVVLDIIDTFIPEDNTAEISPEPEDFLLVAGTPTELVVAGEIVATIPLTLSEDNIIMVPLYLTCPGLELSLEWVEETQTVIVGGTSAVTIGEDNYVKMNEIRLSLGAPPFIMDDRTYVPLSYFTQFLGINNAYYFEGQIVIDNFEKME